MKGIDSPLGFTCLQEVQALARRRSLAQPITKVYRPCLSCVALAALFLLVTLLHVFHSLSPKDTMFRNAIKQSTNTLVAGAKSTATVSILEQAQQILSTDFGGIFVVSLRRTSIVWDRSTRSSLLRLPDPLLLLPELSPLDDPP